MTAVQRPATEAYILDKRVNAARELADLFFPSQGGEYLASTVAICDACPVRRDCLDYAVRHRIRFGMWGGLSERARVRLRTGDRPPPARRWTPRDTVSPYKRSVIARR